jgi:hypothetical protein
VTVALAAVGLARADGDAGSLNSCLAAWGKHPFGSTPGRKTLSTSVKVFGVGTATADWEQSEDPSLTMVNPGGNLMSDFSVERVGCGPG